MVAAEAAVLVIIFGVVLPIEAVLWCEKSCQFGVMFGILGGNCAMTHKYDSTQQTHQTKFNDNLLQKLTQTYNVGKPDKTNHPKAVLENVIRGKKARTRR